MNAHVREKGGGEEGVFGLVHETTTNPAKHKPKELLRHNEHLYSYSARMEMKWACARAGIVDKMSPLLTRERQAAAGCCTANNRWLS